MRREKKNYKKQNLSKVQKKNLKKVVVAANNNNIVSQMGQILNKVHYYKIFFQYRLDHRQTHDHDEHHI